jgi:hypothetical protein
VAYLLDWRHHYAPRALQYLLARGVRVEVAIQPFTAAPTPGTHAFSAGSISVPVALNTDRSAAGVPMGAPPRPLRTPAELHALVRAAAEHAGVPVTRWIRGSPWPESTSEATSSAPSPTPPS